MAIENESTQQTPEVLKELGNAAVKNEKFEEAIIHYTYGIKLDDSNYTLYSNRSYAFLKTKQYYLALQDANETIKLNPAWPKGYFRRGEVLYAVKHYLEATSAYREALILKPNDINLIDALNRTTKAYISDRKVNEVMPWLGAGIGIIVGVILVIADSVFTHKPTHPILMALVTIIIALIGYGIARTYRYYAKCRRDGYLEPPVSLDDIKEKEKFGYKDTKETIKHNTPRYTKSQARQRYKKGKQ